VDSVEDYLVPFNPEEPDLIKQAKEENPQVIKSIRGDFQYKENGSTLEEILLPLHNYGIMAVLKRVEKKLARNFSEWLGQFYCPMDPT
jgi:hypothetical protein